MTLESQHQGAQNRITLTDIAQAANVSVKTVSIALNDKPGVSMALRDKIKQIANELGYNLERSRNTKQFGIIGVLVPDLQAAHYGELAHHVDQYAERHGLATIIQETNDNENKELRAAELLINIGVDAVILTSSRVGSKLIETLEQHHVYVVSIVSARPKLQEPLPQFKSAPIVINHYLGVYQSTMHLIELGHTLIAFIAGPTNSSSSIAKQAGWQAALDEKEISLPDKYVIKLDKERFDYQTGYDACSDLMQWHKGERPTAIVCYNDELAIGALQYLVGHGINVPKDVSIIGNDDIERARFSNPSLTTSHVPRREIASIAIDMIIGHVKGKTSNRQIREVIPQLQVRKSTVMVKSSQLKLVKRAIGH